jgi:hypothetical protein
VDFIFFALKIVGLWVYEDENLQKITSGLWPNHSYCKFLGFFSHLLSLHFQCALLYTTIDGQRRIRITTLSVPCTTVLSNIFRGADLDAQFTYFLKHGNEYAWSARLSIRHVYWLFSDYFILLYALYCRVYIDA